MYHRPVVSIPYNLGMVKLLFWRIPSPQVILLCVQELRYHRSLVEGLQDLYVSTNGGAS